MRVALAHDWLVVAGGSEAVLAALLELFPTAHVYTLVFDGEGPCGNLVRGSEVHTSFLQQLARLTRDYRVWLPLMPLAVELFDLRDYELVISSSHAVAKGVRTRPHQLHISYVHTPMRYAWDLEEDYLSSSPRWRGVRGALARVVLHYLRIWDLTAASRVDVFVANSRFVAQRIWKAYRRRAHVIYPPVDVDRFEPKARREDYYVTVTRLVPYKRVDVLVEAFRITGLPLVVIGDGPERRRLQRDAPPNVRFLGRQPDALVKEHLERARAFVFAGEEDFGIAVVEAQAAGAPVIAYGRGGVTESVVPGETGLFFHEQTPRAVAQAVQEFERNARRFSVERLRANAERFSKQRFKKEFMELVEREWERFRRRLARIGFAGGRYS